MEKSNKLEQQPSVEPVIKVEVQNKEITTEGVTPLHKTGDGYVEFEGKLFREDALKELRPDLFKVKADSVGSSISTNFGTQFPNIATKGDVFVRVDVLPNKVFKFDGRRWIEINKSTSQSYLDQGYLDFLSSKIISGEYDIELLSEAEKDQVMEHIRARNA